MINKIDYCTNRNITGSFPDVQQIVAFIRNPPSEHIELVQNARSLERSSNDYKAIKINRLPAISINFNFSDGYITGTNVAESTGYLYIDVDGMIEQDLDINTTYVCAYWRSLSNTGLTLVVKVDGLTPKNFKIATQEIANALDIPYDNRAVSIDRLTVLSYDPDAYYNDDVEIFPVAEMIAELSVELVQDNIKIVTEKSTQYNTIIKTKLIGYDYIGYKLRFDNLDESLQHYDIVFDENGLFDFGKDDKLKYSLIFVPFRKILKGQRESIFKSIAYQLIALNKTADKKLILKYLRAINYGKMIPPLENSEIEATVNKIYKNLNEIEPLLNAERRFIYDKSKNLTPTEKRRLNIKQVHKDRTSKTQSELLEVMKNWDFESNGKMTIKNLHKVSGKNRKTIQTYYRGLKNEITVTRHENFENFKKLVNRNSLLENLDDLMRYDLSY